jgi:hypothetical protein
MANIRVDIDYIIEDGTEIKFRSPADCSAITGLVVYYPSASGSTTSKVFMLADAHGNNVGDIDHLFAENVVVKVILDVTNSVAFVQNADTNAYLEAQLASRVKKSGDTMTGTLYRQGGAGAIGLAIGTAEKPENVSIISVGDGTDLNRFAFRQYGSNGKRENYNLPDTTTPSVNTNYNIVTSKSARTLWTNASTGSTFAAQTITVNGLSNCECIAVIFGQVTGTSNSAFPFIAHKSVSLSTNTNVNAVRYDATNKALYNVERWITINFANNTIVFSAGKQNGATQNERAIPIAVIGLY